MYSASPVNDEPSYPSVRPSFPLSACIEKLSTQNIFVFLQSPLSPDNENVSGVSDPIPYPEYKYLSQSSFLVKLTTSNKEFHGEYLLSKWIVLTVNLLHKNFA